MVAPGTYTATLTVNGQAQSKTFAVKADPRVTAAGMTDAVLTEQVAFQLKVRDAISEVRKLQQAIDAALQQAGVKPPAPAPPGARPMDLSFAHPLQKVWAMVNDMPGAYPQPMLASQFQNVYRMVSQADQRVGTEAAARLDDLMKELAAAQAALKAAGGN